MPRIKTLIDPRVLLCAKPFDATAWAQVVAEDCHARIGNAPPLVGRSAVLRAVVAIHESIKGIGDHFFDSWAENETVFVETDISFGTEGRRDQWVPCVVIMRVTDAKLRDFRLVLDPSPIRGWPELAP